MNKMVGFKTKEENFIYSAEIYNKPKGEEYEK